LVVRTL
jgi:hypothetical protein